ncbi:hypothetical protein [Geobacter sp. DSM 9736]|uniref:hypothetical protein n=1 Tax=Geobacter sp. DSM 9736 TaxID=1277350 RepID=UPI001E390A70|nr:hypothetical protein [Geobacter sp. DSM 9736]
MAVGYREKDLRELVKAAGGRWSAEQRLWFVPYSRIRGTELEGRVPPDVFKIKRK